MSLWTDEVRLGFIQRPERKKKRVFYTHMHTHTTHTNGEELSKKKR